MKIYWTANSVPELQGLDKKQQREKMKTIQKAGRKAMGNQFWIRFGIFVVAVIIFAFIFISAVPVGIFSGMVIGGFVGLLAVLLIQTPMIDAGLQQMRNTGEI